VNFCLDSTVRPAHKVTSFCWKVVHRLEGYQYDHWGVMRGRTHSCAASLRFLVACKLCVRHNAWLLVPEDSPLLSCTSMVRYTTFGRCAHFTVGSNILLFGL
jgi:hypothetical protein